MEENNDALHVDPPRPSLAGLAEERDGKQGEPWRQKSPTRGMRVLIMLRTHLEWAASGGGGYSFVACLSHLTIDHSSSLSRWSTVPTRNRGGVLYLWSWRPQSGEGVGSALGRWMSGVSFSR